jgi:tryptophan-rich sensory protein
MYDSIWYESLTKPFLLPPAQIFSPVWIILYATLLISLIFYALAITGKSKLSGYVVFIIHMIFNLLWSFVFFSLQRIDLALVVIVIMDLTAIYIAAKFYTVSKFSGIILIPYLIWIFFATYLNIMFLILN